MKKILLLGGYGTVGSVVARDLVESGFFVGIAGRNGKKIEELRNILGNNQTHAHIIDFGSEKNLIKVLQNYDVILNCVEYTLNQMILQACIKSKKHYIDLGDYYEGIIKSRSYDPKLRELGIVGILGAGSSPGIINVMIAHVSKNKKKVNQVIVSFADIVHQSDETMLPFNFQTVVEEITGEALAFENGAYTFIPGASKSISVDFGTEFGKAECYITNHDEQYSLPIYLKNKGIKKCYFVMNHNPLYLQLVPAMKKLGFFSDKKIQVGENYLSPLEFTNSYMKRFLPKEFTSDDKEILYAQVDETVIGVINKSSEGIPAGIINTGIGASLIAQYLATHHIEPGIHHPEDCIDSEWMISELKNRGFTIQIDGISI